MSNVRFRLVRGFKGHYGAGTDGSIWSRKTGEWKKLKPSYRGNRPVVNLTIYGIVKQVRLQRLILETFVGPCPKGMECCHFPDPNPSNVNLSNLRWDTHSNNMKEARFLNRKGAYNPNSTFSEKQVKKIRRWYATGDYRLKDIADFFNVAISTIARIVKGERWNHVQ